MDPNDLLEPVDILGQIPGSFYTQIESKKWSDRKEALETIEKITSVPNIKPSDFSELVRILKKTIAKDANIVVIALAAKCLCQLAQGLRTNFYPYSNSCLSVLFEKFKEKKPNVISVVRDAADAVFVGTTIENIHEEIIQFLDNKNPQIKSEMGLFLSRTYARYPAQVANKKTLRPLMNALIKTLSDMDSTVRDNSAMAIGTAMKVTGEKLIMSLIGDIEPIKIAKIKECCEKAEIIVAPSNGMAEPIARETNGQPQEQMAQSDGPTDDGQDDEERIYDMLDAVDITDQIPASFYAQMESKKWSERKEALEIIEKVTSVPKIRNSDFSELVRILKKTIAKDANVVVTASAAKCLCQLAQGLRANFAPYSNSSLTTIFDKFKEKKPNVISVLRDAADAAFVGTNFENIYEEIIQFLDNKNPQIKSEMSLFLSRMFAKYPVQVLNKKTLRPLINALIKTLSDMDATVRDNSAMAIGTAMKVTGEKLMMTLIADVEPIKIPKIKEFCEKAQVKKIPPAVLNAINTNASAPLPQNNHQAPPPPRSSATMVRSTSNRRLTTGGIGKTVAQKPGSAHPPSQPNSNATVKRNATIIKRSTGPKRSMLPPASQQQTQQQQQQYHQPQQPQQQQTANHASTNMGPPQAPASMSNNHSGPAQPGPQTNFASTPVKPSFSTIQRPTNNTNSNSNNNNNDNDNMITNDVDEAMNSLTELEEMLTDDSEHEFKNRINQTIDLVCLQLIKSFDDYRTNPADDLQSQRITKISALLKKLFARRQLIAAASQQSIRFLLVQLFTLTQSFGNISEQGDATVRKSVNKLALAVMDSFEPTNIMCILSGLLNEPTSVSIVEPVKDAIIRSMRSFK